MDKEKKEEEKKEPEKKRERMVIKLDPLKMKAFQKKKE